LSFLEKSPIAFLRQLLDGALDRVAYRRCGQSQDFADLAVAQTSRAEQQALALGVGEQTHRAMQPPEPFFFEHGPLRRRFIDRGRFDFGIQWRAEAPTIGLLAVARGIVGHTNSQLRIFSSEPPAAK